MRPLSSKLFLLLALIFLNLTSFKTVFGNTDSPVIYSGSSIEQIKKAQKLFLGVGLYSGEIDGNYESIKSSISNYKLAYSIVSSLEDPDSYVLYNQDILSIKDNYSSKFKSNNSDNSKDKKVEKYFIVTAYYSPLPDQNSYMRGSYEADKRLNGNGTHGASGKEVHPGFLAAPKNYDFGTKIYLEGLGVGVVEDRGGAIVNAGLKGHEYDRIDVWMGYGDEGLERAKKWGKRTIKGEIVSKSEDLTIEFKTYLVDSFSDLTLDGDNPEKEDVERLQLLFSKLNLYNGAINGEYLSIKDVLIDYQKKNGIIDSRDDWGAGFFGSKTYSAIRREYGNIELKQEDLYLVNGEYKFYLSNDDIDKINKIRDKIVFSVSVKSNGNKIKQDSYINKIKSKLETYIESSKDEVDKKRLEYLKSII